MDLCGKCSCYHNHGTACVCALIAPENNYLWPPGTPSLQPGVEAIEVDRAWRDEMAKYAINGVSGRVLEPLGKTKFVEMVKEGGRKVASAIGRPYYVVSYSWWSAWKEYSLWEKDGVLESSNRARGPRPPPIDNSDLIMDESESPEQQQPAGASASAGDQNNLRRGLKEDSDYIIVPPLVWLRLWAWYGGGPCIQRAVIRSDVSLIVDLFPVHVHAEFEHQSQGEYHPPCTVMIPSVTKLRMVRHWIVTPLNRAPHKADVSLKKPDPTTGKDIIVPMTDLNKTLEDYGFAPASHCSLLVRFTEEAMGSFGTGGSYWSGGYGTWVPPKPPSNEIGPCLSRGVCGLYNLGNTCFMNSTLFCLASIPPLAALMLHPDWVINQVNRANLVGSKGELAMSLSGLFEEMWSGHYKVVVPEDFRRKLQAVAPQFRGYQQHDAQEMLLMTLNTLHEDLLAPAGPNGQRVEKSSILDMFGGTFQSTIVCDTCKVQSVRKEPFLNLAVPVPEKEERKLKVLFFPANGQPVFLGVRVNKSGNVQHLYQRLSEMRGVAPDRLASLQVSGQNSCYQVTPNKSIAAFREKDRVLIFELPGDPAEVRSVSVFSFERTNFGQLVPMGSPILVCFPKGSSGQAVSRAISEKFRALAHVGLDEQARSLRLVKFGGKDVEKEQAGSAFPYQATDFAPAADSAVAVEWDQRQAEQLKMAYQGIPEDASCAKDERDAEMTVSLTECLALLNVPDTLTAGDVYRCDTCQGMREAVKTMSIWQLPPVLCIHLKRFKIDFVAKEKLHTLIKFTDVLDMAPFVVSQPDALPPVSHGGRYRLVAVSNHVGGLSGGHYTADAWNAASGKWYHFDDRSSAETRGWEAAVTPEAYVLFYVAEGLLGLDLPEPVPIVRPAEDDTAAPEPAKDSAQQRKTGASNGESSATGATTAGGKSELTTEEDSGSTSAPKKLKGVGGDADSRSKDPKEHRSRDDHFRRHDAHDMPHQENRFENRGGGASSEPPAQNLAGSAYICDNCNMPIPGGFDALLRHCAQVHDIKM